ncbi:Glucan endo-1,3-beta-glucosidase 14 [Hibiscus syriacus]|uniref:glucan endo-1,3-beta-D-glucosidase n=1 Tax=Hibiscus syriacus TaxID=106335 RepID=A0A6A2YNA9_HIBSY|nr:Glucan endo-1,3-beta-glucosidase 14 [Hibiscus syriacus]
MLFCFSFTFSHMDLWSKLWQDSKQSTAPESVVTLLKAAKINHIRIYDADHGVLQAFKDPAFLPGTRIQGIAVGNEILGGTTMELWEVLLPAAKNVMPLFTDWDYTVLCRSQVHTQRLYNPGIYDAKTKLHYDNMFEAQVDAAYAALEKAGFSKMEVIVSETGWASHGDPDEAGATVKNAKTYNKNLRKRLAKKKGTPFRPHMVVRAYVFALFNENSKPGPTSERNFGLFKPDGSIAYDIGFTGLVPSAAASSSLLSFKDFAAQGWLRPSYVLVSVASAVVLLQSLGL